MNQNQRKTATPPSGSAGQSSSSRRDAEGRASSGSRQEAQHEVQALTDGWNFRLLV
jgi:hypothetical protein